MQNDIHVIYKMILCTQNIIYNLSTLKKFTVWKYWKAIQLRPSFKLAQGTAEYTDHEIKVRRCKKLIDEWKSKYAWFDAMYQG